jgi:pimeloyl-ACP methyl ester carboxylesterase
VLLLEVIDKGSISKSHSAPLLFVHGGQHAAWCWDESFLDFFATNGYRPVAVSLRGHGTSPNPVSPRACSIADYVEDVCEVAERLPHAPVVIGHSLGGFVAQKYLESHAASAAVLIASAPPQGVGAGMLRTAAGLLRTSTRHPWLSGRATLAGKSASGSNKPDRVREMFFSPHTPESLVVRYAERLEKEHIGRFALDMAFLNLPKPDRVSTPMLVLGAQCDRSVTPREVRATARSYRTQAEIFPNMGHDMMLEPGWAAVAERIDTWLSTRGL